MPGRRVVTCARSALVAAVSAAVAAAVLLPAVPALSDPLDPDFHPSAAGATAQAGPSTEPSAVGPEEGVDDPGSPDPTPTQTPPTASESPTGEPSATPEPTASSTPSTDGSPTASPTTSAPTDVDPGTGPSTDPTAGPSVTPTTAPPSGPTSPPPAEPTVQPPIAWDAASVVATGATVLQSFTASPVTVRTVCGDLVFANANARLSAEVGWGHFDARQPSRTVTLKPGQAVRVSTSTTRNEWAARWDDGRATPFGTAGRGVVSTGGDTCTTQARQPSAAIAVVAAPCLGRRQPVSVLVTGSVRPGTRWAVSAADNPQLTLVDGVLDAAGPVTADLSGYGAGRYEVVLMAGDRKVDQSTFAVQDCVTADVTCDAVGWTNPSRNFAVTVAFRTGGGTATQAVRLSPGQSARVDSLRDQVQWSASAMSASGSRVSDAGAEVAAPSAPGCTTEPSNVAPPEVVADTAGDDVVAVSPTAPAAPGPASRSGWPGVAALVAGLAAAAVVAGARCRRRRISRQ